MSFTWFGGRSSFVSVDHTVHHGSAFTARKGLEKIRREYVAQIASIDSILETSGPWEMESQSRAGKWSEIGEDVRNEYRQRARRFKFLKKSTNPAEEDYIS